MPAKRLLIAGCGDLGIRLHERLDSSRWQVTGLRRNVAALPAGIAPVSADLSRPQTLEGLQGRWDAVLYQATPASRDETTYRRTYVEGLSHLLERVDARRLIYVSSTAVYGQDDGSWVDESSATEPNRFNGRILLEGERLAAGAECETVVVRFSGIYGPGREYLIESLRSGQASCRPEPPQWTNRIHADDCAAVIAHLLELPRPKPLYCASDCRPARRCEVLDWLAAKLNLPVAERLGSAQGDGQGKRISCQRLLAGGFRFQYPDFTAGYGAMLS